MSTDETREKLLQAAGPIFAAKGFKSATVREICAAAKVNLASVNYYFGDKDRLYIETVKRAHQRRVAEAPQMEFPSNASAADRLRTFIRILLERMLVSRSRSWETQILMAEILNPTAACKELVEKYFRPQLEILMDVLAPMLPPDLPDYRRQQAAFSVVGQCLYYRVADSVVSNLISDAERQMHFSLEKLADHIVELTLAGIAGLGRSPPDLFPSSSPSFGADDEHRSRRKSGLPSSHRKIRSP